jgi:hypothetical protein
MATPKLLRTPDNPGGQPLGTLLRRIRKEIELVAVAHGEGEPVYGTVLQLVGLLLQAEGVHAEASVAGHAIDSFPGPRANLSQR